MSRIRLNQEYRNKIANRMRVHLEQEDTVEKKEYDNLKADQIDLNDNAWALAKKIVRRAYPDEDVKLAQYLQNKFGNQNIRLRERMQSDGSVEVYLGEEFIGVIYKDEEEGDISYDFNMSILEIDLPSNNGDK